MVEGQLFAQEEILCRKSGFRVEEIGSEELYSAAYLLEHFSPEDLAFDGKATPLVVIEQKALLAEFLLEHLIFSSQVGGMLRRGVCTMPQESRPFRPYRSRLLESDPQGFFFSITPEANPEDR